MMVNLFLQKKGGHVSENQWGISDNREVPVKEYDKLKGKNRYVINISRGCPFGCEHCLIQLTEGRTERRRSIENLRRALGLICKDYKHIKVWAANFTLNKGYVHKFCEMMGEDYPDITWECATRIDLVRDIELLKKMHDSGCKQISLGIESLNNGDLIGTKDFKVQEIETAIDNIQSQGIKVKGCIMLGMPNQSRQSIVNTIAFLKRKNVTIRPTIYTPYHLINDDTHVNELSQYNRKTYENTSVKDITHKQLLKLVQNPYDYETILELDKEEIWEI